MIHAVRSDQLFFRPVEFTPGFNLILAERTKEATAKDTRNGLGKSTLIEIIHFCLGSTASKNKGLLVAPLHNWTFTVDLTLAGQRISVSRNTGSPSRVAINGDTSAWPIQPSPDKYGRNSLDIQEWRDVLGALMFGLPINDPLFESRTYRPTYRSLISYFIRRSRDAFSTPFEHHRKQQEWDKQVNNAFLLGLAWEDASDWQELKDRKKLLDDLERAVRSGMMRDMLGSRGELEAAKVRLETKARQEEAQLRNFQVHPKYRDIELQADQLTADIHQATNANVVDTRLLSLYQESLQEEREPVPGEVARVYQEAGVTFPGRIQRRLEDVEEFHRQLIVNRKQFLAIEIDRLRRAISAREDLIRFKATERAALMQILRTHGALDEYTRLQTLHLTTVTEVQRIETRIDSLKQFEEGKSALRIEQELLQQRARSDYEERRVQRERAIALFNASSEALYDVPGTLVIDIGPNGFQFNVEIERSGSQGISNMKVFCYDLMLAQLWADHDPSPCLLVHDSTIFDGVDERQVAHALELAARRATEYGFQYICTLNSDTIPRGELSPAFDLDSYVRLTLTDTRDDGGLLGFRF